MKTWYRQKISSGNNELCMQSLFQCLQEIESLKEKLCSLEVGG